jgi:hypothetical protein
MNYLLGVSYLFIFLAVLTACGGRGDEIENYYYNDEYRAMDFRSVRDREKRVIVSLGDSRERTEAALGEPMEVTELLDESGETLYFLEYESGMTITIRNETVTGIITRSNFDRERFEIYGHGREWHDQRPVVLDDGTLFYSTHVVFDAYGNEMERILYPESVVIHFVMWLETEYEKTIYLSVQYTR